MIAPLPAPRNSAWPALALALVANAVWINASEIFRYFAFVMPMMREAFPQLDQRRPHEPDGFRGLGTVGHHIVAGHHWIRLAMPRTFRRERTHRVAGRHRLLVRRFRHPVARACSI